MALPRLAPPSTRIQRKYTWLVLAILILAAGWRAIVALTIPCITRDSVMFCEHGRALGERGMAYLQEPVMQQHPLFPAAGLVAQRTARLFGAADSPMTWQRSGQVVAWLAGLAVVGLAGAVTRRFVQRLELPIDARLAGCCGMLLAALLPLNVWLSAEVMSDQLHLAFYLLGVLALLKLNSAKMSLLCGLAGGLAFLTRPEGIIVVLAGLATFIAARRIRWRIRALHAVVMIAAFMACALPYWISTGTLSAKKNPLEWLHDDEVAGWSGSSSELCVVASGSYLTAGTGPGRYRSAGTGPGRYIPRVAHGFSRGGHELSGNFRSVLLAKLELLDVRWHALVLYALERMFRAGRVVLPLLALIPVITLLSRLFRPPLIGLSACLIGHFTLTLILLAKCQYLAPRHMLVVVVLLIPFAATLLSRLIELVMQGRWPVTPVIVVLAIAFLPLVLYSLRQPNAGDRYLVDMARWLRARDPTIFSKVIMSGASQRRVAFYAEARWISWFEAPEDVDGLRRQILAQRPDYFLIETGTGFEREGNEALVERLRNDPQLMAHTHIESRPIPEASLLHFFFFDWVEE